MMQCEECQQPLWRAGENVPPGTYARVDDHSYRMVRLEYEGPLPATFDGHTAWYCPSARPCTCGERTKQLMATSGLDEGDVTSTGESNH